MKHISFLLLIIFFSACQTEQEYEITSTLRAPAYPLISIDPYTNAWMFADKLYTKQVTHNNGKEFPLLGAIRVDNRVFRFMGTEQDMILSIAPTAEQGDWEGRYTFSKPEGDWQAMEFDDNDWQTGQAAFGFHDYEPPIKTPWTTEDIWVRREVIIEEDLSDKTVYLYYSHDDDMVIYMNGVKVIDEQFGGYHKDRRHKLSPSQLQILKKGKNIIAAHCHNRENRALLDFGLGMELPINHTMPQTAVQRSVEALPTQTIYTFRCGTVDLKLTFTAPLLMDNLDLMSRPVNYISYEVVSNDSKAHEVELYLEAGTNWALNTVNQSSHSEAFRKDNLLFLKTGSKEQAILGRRGENSCIDWGYFYLCADESNTQSGVGDRVSMRKSFCEKGKVETETPPSIDQQDYLAFSRSLGKVRGKETGYFMIGYDDVYSIQYFGENLRPYWNRSGDKDIVSLFFTSAKEYKQLKRACDNFDRKMINDATICGGKEYAELCALAYRQTIAAHKLTVAPNGDLLYMLKETGNISTVDVIYPSSPLFLLYNVDLLKASLNPILYYAASEKWTHPYAPHDLGSYPIAKGQGGDIHLPVEESGNMLILLAAIATMDGNAVYAEQHWETISGWADFLLEKGFDPENQRNTDMFTGYSAHNTNLSIKAILGLASYGRLADMLGKNEVARKYTNEARAMALEWVRMANDGDHYRFAFDQPGTWGQKYNLVWDKILKINVFPHEIPEQEVAYYLTKQNLYGLPLDSREAYTKSDWIVWSATLSPNKEMFQQFIFPLYRFVNKTTDRVPMSDWYWTDRPQRVAFQGRSVVGGYFIKMVEDKLVNR